MDGKSITMATKELRKMWSVCEILPEILFIIPYRYVMKDNDHNHLAQFFIFVSNFLNLSRKKCTQQMFFAQNMV